MQVFTISPSNKLSNGTKTAEHKLGNGYKMTVVSIGEQGRGREFSFLPVEGATPEQVIRHASIGKTLKGQYKLIANTLDSSNECLLVLQTGMGFRGGSQVTVEGEGSLTDLILIKGMIAQGAAGNMGRSTQYILRLPKDVVLSIKLTGRMYGNPDQYYARFDGFKMELVTAEDRKFLDW